MNYLQLTHNARQKPKQRAVFIMWFGPQKHSENTSKCYDIILRNYTQIIMITIIGYNHRYWQYYWCNNARVWIKGNTKHNSATLVTPQCHIF